MSVVEKSHKVESAEALRVSKYVDLEELPVPDREAHN